MINYDKLSLNPSYVCSDGKRYSNIAIVMNDATFYVAKSFTNEIHYGYFMNKEEEKNEIYYSHENAYDLNRIIFKQNELSIDELENLLSCANKILDSYSNCVSNSHIRQDLEYLSEYEDIKNYGKYIADMLKEIIKTQKNNRKGNNMKWIRTTNLDEIDFNEILNLFSKYFNENPNEKEAEIIYNNTHYKMEYNDVEEQYIFKVLVPDDYADDNDGVVNNNSIRAIIKLAKMKKCEGLDEFINGNFYPIIKTQVFNNKKYITIKNDKNEERTIREDRFDIVEVYNEPPKND